MTVAVPPTGELHIWFLPIRARDRDSLGAIRFDGCAATEPRQREEAAREGLRRVLGGYLNTAPDEVRIVQAPCPRCGEPHGRPELHPVHGGTARLRFSLTHCTGLALGAVAAHPVGVDAEALAARVDDDDLRATLHPDERRQCAPDPTPGRRTALLGCWVRKEAYLKGLGIGLGRDPDTVAVGLPAATPDAPRAQPGPEGWTLVDIPAGPHHVAAAAIDGRLTTVRVFSQPNNVSVSGHGEWETRVQRIAS